MLTPLLKVVFKKIYNFQIADFFHLPPVSTTQVVTFSCHYYYFLKNISANFRKNSKRSLWDTLGLGGNRFMQKTWCRESRDNVPLIYWWQITNFSGLTWALKLSWKVLLYSDNIWAWAFGHLGGVNFVTVLLGCENLFLGRAYGLKSFSIAAIGA